MQLEIETALSAHELLKIRINAETREDRELLTAAICKERNAELIQRIGHIIVIYRPDNKSSSQR